MLEMIHFYCLVILRKMQRMLEVTNDFDCQLNLCWYPTTLVGYCLDDLEKTEVVAAQVENSDQFSTYLVLK